MTKAEQRLADALMAAGYTFMEVTAILITVTAVARNETQDRMYERMGTIALAALKAEFL